MNHPLQNSEFQPAAKPDTLFLPGWSFDGRILQLLTPHPSWINPEKIIDPDRSEQDILQLLDENGIEKIRLAGWSMGAMLALNFAANHPDRIDSLILISLRSHWPMSEIKEIKKKFLNSPAYFLKDFYRKCFLGDKQAYTIFQTRIEPIYLSGLDKNIDILQRGLDFLGSFIIPKPVPDLPIRLIHGKQDIVSPFSDMPALPGADLEIIDNAGHAPFLHEACTLQQEFRKQVIQQKFSRAAESYDKFAKVQAEVAGKLAAKLPSPTEKRKIKTILELGCGTGNFTTLLAARFPAADIVALDFSREMIDMAGQKLQNPRIQLVCADGEYFLENTAANTFDLVVSNGSLQWFADIERALHNISRILVPGGSMLCTIFGPESLRELAMGLQAVQTQKTPLAAQKFPGFKALNAALHKNFPQNKGDEEFIEKEYRSAQDLLLHIKKTGTAGWSQKILQPLTPAKIKLLDKWFKEKYGACRVTYQIFYLQGENS